MLVQAVELLVVARVVVAVHVSWIIEATKEVSLVLQTSESVDFALESPAMELRILHAAE